MTTIVASLPHLLMAADSRVVYYDMQDIPKHASQCYKLYKNRKYIIGCAGHADDITNFILWLGDQTKRRRKVIEDFQAVMLSRKELLCVDDNTIPEPCKLPFHAIGSGSGYALAALSTMSRLGVEMDAELAVSIACEHDTGTAGPIDVVRWPIRQKP